MVADHSRQLALNQFTRFENVLFTRLVMDERMDRQKDVSMNKWRDIMPPASLHGQKYNKHSNVYMKITLKQLTMNA